MVAETVIPTDELVLTSSNSQPTVEEPVLESTLKVWQTVGSTFPNWENRATVFKQVLGILRELYNILGKIPDVLGADGTISVRSSIALVLTNNSMDALIARDSLTGHFETNTHREFRWGEDAKGIAGVCATRKEHILISDINDPQNPDIKFLIASKTFSRGGILSIPILLNPDASPDEKQCIAVFTVTSSKPKFLEEHHYQTLVPIIENIRSIFINDTLPSLSDRRGRTRLDMLVLQSYANSTMEREDRAQQSEGIETVKRDVKGLISKLATETRAGKKAVKAIEILDVMNSTDGQGVTMENLHPFFDESEDPPRQAAAFIGLLNKRYLKPLNIKIVGTVVYKFFSTR